MAYQLEGRILEVCSCNVLCPCWIGEDPDDGICEALLAYSIDKGTIDGVDVSGRKVGIVSHIPGNVFQVDWKVVLIIDDGATDAQQDALVRVWSGKLGGPVADLAQLVGEVVAVERAPFTFTVEEGHGTVVIGEGPAPLAEADLTGYQGATGQPTVLLDTIFSTIPGSPAYVSKASRFRRNSEQYGLVNVDLADHNAIQGSFLFEA